MKIAIVFGVLVSVLNLPAAVESNRISFVQSEILSIPNPPPSDAVGYLSKVSFSGGAYHGDLFYSENGANLVRYEYTVDMYAEWYALDYGIEFSPTTYPKKPYPLNISFDIPLEISSSPFYLGVHLYISGNVGFGWAKMVNDFDGLRLLDSGFSFSDKGVYIGTFSEVPEPNYASLLVAGICIAAFSRSIMTR
jgi:hypothetical protein